MKNIIKPTAAIVFAGIISLTAVSSVYAVQPNPVRSAIKQEVREEVMEMKNNATAPGQTVKTMLKEQNQSERQNLMNTIKNKIKALLPHRIHGTLAKISGQTLTVQTEKGDITVYVTDKTQLRRRFGGKSSLDEFQVGDELAVIGAKHKTSDTEFSDTEIDARYIRNISIQRRNTVFVGSITEKGTDSFKVQTISRGVQTVHVYDNTVYTEKNTTISLDDLNVGDRVLVKGEIWDRTTSEIDAKKVMKLPLVPTPSAAGQSSSATSSTSSSEASSI